MSKLFSPYTIRETALRNRVVAGPMCMYSAQDGLADDYHLVHLGRFALGGFGMVMTEAVAVLPEGRISHGCLGLWDDAQIKPLARIANFLKSNGAVPAIQLSHAGRKAASRRPWRGEGTVTAADLAELGDAPWTTRAPSAIAHSGSYAEPTALDGPGIARISKAFSEAAQRAMKAGFEIVELHLAHGYLLNQFLSPIANQRTDDFGGSLANRMRLPLAIARRLRDVWPEKLPVFVRISATDNIPGGWNMGGSMQLAAELQSIGIDVVACSSGGFEGASRNAFTDNHVPYAASIKSSTGLGTMALGLVSQPEQAESILQSGSADLVAIAREALVDPNWPMHASLGLDGRADWPPQAAWALRDR